MSSDEEGGERLPALSASSGRGLTAETQTLKPFGEAETIGTTSNHPFWSVDRQEYVQAGSLQPGERLQTLHGDTKVVVSNLPRPGPKTDVYNLEVHAEHVYFVGEDGVLVHNAYNKAADVSVSGNLRTETLQNGTKRFYFKQNGQWTRVKGASGARNNPRHHLFAQEFRSKFEELGIANIDDYTIELSNAIHGRLHAGPRRGGAWNQAWDDFFANPNVSDVDAYRQVGRMIRDFDIDGLPLIPYRAPR